MKFHFSFNKIIIFLSLIIASSLNLARAKSGGMEGGGGKSVVCRDNNHKIISAELLDIWEGKNLYNLNINRSGDVGSIISEVKEKLKNSLEQPEIHIFPLIERVQKILKIAKPGAVLKDIDDSAEIAWPNNCKLEQLANYVDDSFLIVSYEIWNQLDNQNKAGLILHEAIYRNERYSGATDSRRARKIVAHLLSDFAFTNVDAALPANAKLCVAVNSAGALKFKYWVYPVVNHNDQQMSKLQFLMMDGKFIYSKKTAILPVAFPWMMPERSGLYYGGDTISNFEGNGRISLGVVNEIIITPESTSNIHYLYLMGDGVEKFETYCKQ